MPPPVPVCILHDLIRRAAAANPVLPRLTHEQIRGIDWWFDPEDTKPGSYQLHVKIVAAGLFQPNGRLTDRQMERLSLLLHPGHHR